MLVNPGSLNVSLWCSGLDASLLSLSQLAFLTVGFSNSKYHLEGLLLGAVSSESLGFSCGLI